MRPHTPRVNHGGDRSAEPSLSDPASASAGSAPTIFGGAGSRAIAQVALSDCVALSTLRMTHRDPALAARAYYGDEIADEGSPIALAVGRQFETSLERADFERFRFALHRAGRLDDAASITIAEIDAEAPGDTEYARAERVRRTRAYLLRAARGDTTVPDVLWHPHVTLPMVGFTVTIIPDYLLLRHTAHGLRVGEIKAYRDRGAYTSIASLRLARLQAAVEVLAVREALRSLGVRDVEDRAPAEVDFMLRTRTSGMFGILRRRPTRIHRDVERVQRALAAAMMRLPAHLSSLPAGTSLDTREGFESLPYDYTEECRGHCALASRCAERAARQGNGAILGDHVASLLGGVVTLHDLDAMLAGRMEPPSPEIAAIVDGFADALRRTGHHVETARAEVRRAG